MTGCQNSQDTVTTIHFDLTNNTKKTYNDIAETTKYIRLDTDSTVTISEVNKIFFADHRINILDKQMASVYTFDESGKFLFKIASPGVGDGKYLRIDDMESNDDGTLIDILDGMSNKLLTYKNGKFLKETKLPFRTDAFTYLNNKIFFHRDIAPYLPDLMYQVIVTDTSFQVIDKFIKIKKATDLFYAPQNPLQKTGVNISFLPVYSPYIYNIGTEGISEKYFLDFGKNWMTDDFIYSKRNSRSFISDISKSDYVYFVNTVDGNNYLTISFVHQHDTYTSVYSKITKKLVFISDFNSSYCGDFGFQAFLQNKFVSLIKPQQFLEAYKQGKITDKKTFDLINAAKGNDNPIIMLTTFSF